MALAGCAVPVVPGDRAAEVAAVERAFARTMAERDHAAFSTFIADEAVFVAGTKVLRGRPAIAAAWRRFYDGPLTPFSWTPDRVEVLASGGLAFSAGPVFDPAGKLVGRFTSIWRLESPGNWRIVFDTGSDVCDCAPAPGNLPFRVEAPTWWRLRGRACGAVGLPVAAVFGQSARHRRRRGVQAAQRRQRRGKDQFRISEKTARTGKEAQERGKEAAQAGAPPR